MPEHLTFVGNIQLHLQRNNFHKYLTLAKLVSTLYDFHFSLHHAQDLKKGFSSCISAYGCYVYKMRLVLSI